MLAHLFLFVAIGTQSNSLSHISIYAFVSQLARNIGKAVFAGIYNSFTRLRRLNIILLVTQECTQDFTDSTNKKEMVVLENKIEVARTKARPRRSIADKERLLGIL